MRRSQLEINIPQMMSMISFSRVLNADSDQYADALVSHVVQFARVIATVQSTL